MSFLAISLVYFYLNFTCIFCDNCLQVVDPSLDLKQRTIAGVTKVKQQLDKTKRARNLILTPAHLQRGHLRSLGRPVTASGPLMNNCQGIMAGKSVT